MKIKEGDYKNDLMSAIGDEIGSAGLYGQTSDAGIEVAKSMSSIKKSLGETKKKKKDDLIRRKIKSGNSEKLVGKKTMGLPIGKLTSMVPMMGEEETTEAMGAGSAGGYSAPLFSVKKKDVEDVTKVETKEATGASSAGSYVTPAAWAKSTKKKDWRGKSKTQIPGGKFVQVKKKCKKFPYCNQGDITALKLTNENFADNVIKRLSEKYDLKESIIRDILSKHYNIKK